MQPQQVVAPHITLGTVVDTNDPQQMGRLRVFCPALNDREDAPASDIPWASYVSPFGGEVQSGLRGPGDEDILGPTAYGMWAIPKIGAQVLIMCLDGRTDHRVWMGCLYGQFLPHTMPHGRFSFDVEDPDLPAGPFDSYERDIEPLTSNMKEAFPTPGQDPNYEWQTRVADFQVAGVTTSRQVEETFSEFTDDADVVIDTPNSKLTESRQGYDISNIDPDLPTNPEVTPANFDNMVTSIVTAGFHGISMDDRVHNQRMRFRTTAGHQIILDDTNERIYVMTAKGKNWIELDQEGNIDIYAEGKMSVNAERDINFTTQGSFRVNAERGMHFKSGKEVRISSEEDINVDTKTNIRAKAQQNILMETTQTDISFRAAKQITMESGTGNISLTSGASVLSSAAESTSFNSGSGFIAGASTIDLGASGAVVVSGSRIDLNGPSAASPIDPTAATPAEPQLSFFPNRKPEHEPWARTGNNDETGEPLLLYTDAPVGQQDMATGTDGTSSEEITFTRGQFWRR